MNTIFLDACNFKKTPYTPVWYMRQAGRYLPAYRKLKEKYSIIQICQTPELAARVAMQPVEALGVDAAILFADIMIPLIGIGISLDIVENVGPVIAEPIASQKQIDAMEELVPQKDVAYISKTIKILKKELQIPLIGFSAAPFTLASYLIEGRPTREFIKTKSFMYTNPKAWHNLMEKLTVLIITYLKSQTDAGVDALQLFDSWVGSLSEDDYKEYVLPYTSRIFDSFYDSPVPLLHFGTGNAGLLQSFSSVNCTVVGIDWRISLLRARTIIPSNKALQGNLDPTVLLAPFPIVKKHIDSMFTGFKREGYIFNLGHGVLPQTQVDMLKRITDYVHNYS